MDFLGWLDDYLLVHLLGRGGLACFVRAWHLNHRTKRLCSIEIQARLPALKALTSPPFEISLAQSFGISGVTVFKTFLRYSYITPQDMMVFSSAVSRGALGSLTYLNLENKYFIGDAGMIAFANAIKPTDEIPMGALATLQYLDLGFNRIGVEGMKAFSTTLSRGALPSLRGLHLWNNDIGDEGMKAFSTALCSGSLASLKVFHLSDNDIGDEGMKAFSTALSSESLASLQELWLNDNEIGDEGMKAFSSALSRGSLASLTTLDLQSNQIGGWGVKAFCSALSSGSLASLQYLGLNDNQISEEGMQAFSSEISRALPALTELAI